MASVDTSFYNSTPPNSLDQAAKAVGIQQGINQNKLFPLQQQQAQQELQKGQNALSLFPIEQQNKQTDLQRNLQGLGSDKLNLMQQKMGITAGHLLPIVNNPNATPQDVINAGINAISDTNGEITPDEVSRELSGMSQHMAQGGTPNSFARELYSRLQAAHGQVQDAIHGLTAQNIGLPSTTPVYQPGSTTPTANIVPQGQPQAPQGQTSPLAGAFGGGQAQPQAGLPAQQTTQKTTDNPPGTVALGLRPGVAEGMVHLGAQSADQQGADLKDAAGYGQRMFNLTQGLQHLQRLGATGPGTDAVNYTKSFLMNMAPGELGKNLPGVDPAKISDYNEANKYMTQFAQNRASGFGNGTDQQLATTLASTPNVKTIDKLSNVDLMKANIALENMNQAMKQSAINKGIPPDQYSKYSATWGNSVDPRAFAIDLLSPQKQAALVKSLKGTERAKFANGLREMKQNNVTIPMASQLATDASGNGQ